jgi:hypothetical protein
MNFPLSFELPAPAILDEPPPPSTDGCAHHVGQQEVVALVTPNQKVQYEGFS